jgi:methionyl-tRNA formyltransferase
MNLQDLRIIFLGTPEFAVASLDALVQAGCNIVGVVTAPDKEGGRGMQLQQSAVKKYAVEKGLNVLQPEKLKAPEFIAQLQSLQADVQVVVAFRMLPEMVWNMPPMGTVNVHGSLLPQYRGAAPINWAIINGEKETGVTTFKLKHEIDTGDILLQSRLTIGEDEDAGSLHDRMKSAGAEVLVKTMVGLASGTLQEMPQLSVTETTVTLKHAPKLYTETCRIDWSKPVDEVYNLVRGLAPYPAAFTDLRGKKLKVYKAQKETSDALPSDEPWVTDNKSMLKFRCADGYLHLLEIQLEGKKRMNVAEFLRGYRFV